MAYQSILNPHPVSLASLPLPAGAALDATLTGGTQQSKITDGSNVVAVAASTSAASETAVDRLKVNAALRLLDTAQTAGSQLVAAKGDQTTGLWVNIKNANVAVTGTFWQATQPVSGTVTANAGTGTFAISAASLPLPAGAATSANQPTSAAAASTTSGQTGHIAMGAVTTAAPTYTTAQTNFLSLTTSGLLRVDASGVTQPVSGTFWQATQPVSLATNTPVIAAGSAIIGKVGIDQTTVGTTNAVALAQIGANTILTGNGVTGTGSQRVTVASDNTPFPVKIDQTTPGTTNAVNSTPATPTASNINSAATTNATSVKASAGTLFGAVCSNSGAAAAFVKLYNKASAPTVGTDVPVITIPIPASGVVSLNIGTLGHRFATGIALAITNLVADSDATAVAAAQVKVMLAYI